MSKFILLPNGDAVSNAVIKTIRHFSGKGVACSDAQQRLVVWVKVVDAEKGQRVRDILIQFVKEERGIPQPDWSFLKDDVVAAE